ncbi:hypothetical protein H6761_03995 [Candidatus Nomurabacteria bacterium]|nr:hypothetical protein [Candidatus Nomurabacteria bacterium]
MKKLIKIQFAVLLLGTVFAWGNFIWELVYYLQEKACPTGCVVGLVNPFLTPCFYGACFFLIAFVLSAMILKENKKEN